MCGPEITRVLGKVRVSRTRVKVVKLESIVIYVPGERVFPGDGVVDGLAAEPAGPGFGLAGGSEFGAELAVSPGGLPVTHGLLFSAGGLGLTATGLGGGGLDGHNQLPTG